MALPERPLRGIAATMALLSALAAPADRLAAQAPTDMLNTKHNLSTSGPGPIRAASESRICVFCHTPHNATPLSPLWNRALAPRTYVVYTSPTLHADPLPQPYGPTKLCLSCHDGTIAMGAVVNPAGGITMAGGSTLPPYPDKLTTPGILANFGTDLSGHHPVSFPYSASLPHPELAPTPPVDLVFGDGDEVHCTTCHDPHNDTFGRFLAQDNRYSALCVRCHEIPGWAGSEHATNTDFDVTDILPRPPKNWPNYTTVAEWGCETCHTPHFAPTAPQLLNFDADFPCTSCHTAEPPVHAPAGAGPVSGPHAPRRGLADIAGQVLKASAHHELPSLVSASRPETAGLAGAACADCHNPHLTSRREAEAPLVSGLLAGVSGVDAHGGVVETARYQYEVCFKCHGDTSTTIETVPRWIPSSNLRLAFAPENPSYHPVVAQARATDLPSIPSSLEPGMTPTQMLYCTDCHADDNGVSNGPHGSSLPPILRERYETADGTPESYESYALCYRCHERSSILADQSFGRISSAPGAARSGHREHLDAGASCAACHDPHGVSLAGVPDSGESGSHTRLINFDKRVVTPLPGAAYPVYRNDVSGGVSCALVCHGVVHGGSGAP